MLTRQNYRKRLKSASFFPKSFCQPTIYAQICTTQTMTLRLRCRPSGASMRPRGLFLCPRRPSRCNTKAFSTRHKAFASQPKNLCPTTKRVPRTSKAHSTDNQSASRGFSKRVPRIFKAPCRPHAAAPARPPASRSLPAQRAGSAAPTAGRQRASPGNHPFTSQSALYVIRFSCLRTRP